ncbi:MAG: TerB family tellurite resistance protein [Nostoc sp. TH1S01]|nr:TerB family tellurite resistance protein [Nostoc sp. TH1S01]
MLKQSTVFTTQLAVVAAVVDGQASEEEINIIVTQVSKKSKDNPEEIRRLTENLVKVYQAKQAGTNPLVALKFAVKALQGLAKRDALAALAIAQSVLESGGVTAEEDSFIYRLSQMV